MKRPRDPRPLHRRPEISGLLVLVLAIAVVIGGPLLWGKVNHDRLVERCSGRWTGDKTSLYITEEHGCDILCFDDPGMDGLDIEGYLRGTYIAIGADVPYFPPWSHEVSFSDGLRHWVLEVGGDALLLHDDQGAVFELDPSG
jgi:hypothetical protein